MSVTPGRATAQQVAIEHLRARIADGSLAPESRIRQEHLAEELGSSVVPVREALKVLEAEGQVLYLPHRGYQVRRLSIADLVETYRIRALLEDEAVRVAAPALDAELFEELEQAMRTMEAAASSADLRAMTEANRTFHFSIFERAAMPRLTDFIRQLWQSTDAYRARYYAQDGHRERVNDEHRRIVAALREHRIDDAVRLLDEHRNAAVASLKAMLEPAGPP